VSSVLQRKRGICRVSCRIGLISSSRVDGLEPFPGDAGMQPKRGSENASQARLFLAIAQGDKNNDVKTIR